MPKIAYYEKWLSYYERNPAKAVGKEEWIKNAKEAIEMKRAREVCMKAAEAVSTGLALNLKFSKLDVLSTARAGYTSGNPSVKLTCKDAGNALIWYPTSISRQAKLRVEVECENALDEHNMPFLAVYVTKSDALLRELAVLVVLKKV